MKKIAKIKDLNKIAFDLIKDIKKIKKTKNKKVKSETATVVALSGDLGAGKTTFTQEIGKILKIKNKMVSPTFVIMKKYPVVDDFFKYLIHIDAYRLESGEELQKLGWEELIKDEKNLIFLEWPERVPECVSSNVYNVELEHIDENTRSIKFWYK